MAGTVVEDGSGAPLSGISVRLLSSGNVLLRSRITAANGSFSIPDVAAGEYRVRFIDLDGSHIGEYHLDAATFALSSPVVVADEVTTTVDGALVPVVGAVSGTVTEAGSGTPLSGISVELLSPSEVLVSSAVTAGDGTYSIPGVVPGEHRVRFVDADGSHVGEYHLDASSFASSSPVVVTGGATTTVDAALVVAPSSVAGTVTQVGSGAPLSGISVRLLSTSNVLLRSRITGVNGGYTIPNVAPGEYRLRFIDLDGSHVGEYHLDAASFASSSPVVVTGGAVTDVDAQLGLTPGEVRGRVTEDGSGAPLAGISVRLLSSSNVLVGSRLTAADGSYKFAIVPQGQYKVRFIDMAGMHVNEYHSEVATFAAGATITVTAASLDIIDASLAPADQRPIEVAVGRYDTDSTGRILTREPGDSWVRESAPGFMGPLHDVAHDGGTTWVAVGRFGSVARSHDAATWTTQQLVGGPWLQSVAHDGNGRWVAVGGSTIVTSPDGITWTPAPDGAGVFHRGVAHDGAGQWVAVGDGGSIRSSTDGVTWTTRSSGTAANLWEVAYDDGTWVAVGTSGTILTSTDGITWTPRTSGVTTTLIDVAHGDGKWIATMSIAATTPAADLVTSPDAITWTPLLVSDYAPSASDTTAQPIAWSDSGEWLLGQSVSVYLWYLTYFTTIYSSGDGVSWSKQRFGGGGDATTEVAALYAFASGSSTGRPSRPLPPTGVILTSADSSLEVSWNASDLNGGDPVTSYTATATRGSPKEFAGSCTWTSGPLGCTITGLTNDVRHYVTVTATSEYTSFRSIEVSAIPMGAPTPPRAAAGVAGDGEVLVSWAIPVNDGGMSVTSYEVTASPGGATCQWTGGPRHCLVSGLTNGEPYSFVVTATNALGTSAASSPSAAVVPTPTPPPPLTYTAVGTGSSIRTGPSTVDWHLANQYISARLVAVDGGAASGWVAVGTSGTSPYRAVIVISDDGTDWHAPTADLGLGRLQDVAYDGAGTWAAVGAGGTIVTSTDRVTWTERESGTSAEITSIAHDGVGRWVAVASSDGSILTSTDAVTWAVATTTGAWSIDGVAHADGLWIVAADGGAIHTSTDGLDWATVTTPTTVDLFGVAHDGVGRWMLVGASGTVLTSTDGSIWEDRSSTYSGTFGSVAGDGAGTWVVHQGASTTWVTQDDGLSWTQVTPGDVAAHAVFDAGVGWITVGWSSSASYRMRIWNSADGLSYSLAPALSMASVTLNGVATDGDGLWAAVGASGTIATATSPGVIAWKPRASGVTTTLVGVAHGGGLWVAVGASGVILTSADGITWTPRTSGTTASLNALAFVDGLWVVVGSSTTILTSPDGITWTPRTGGASSMVDVASDGAGNLVALSGGSSFATSADGGTTWTLRSATALSSRSDVAYFDGLWVAVGSSGKSSTSVDGIAWTAGVTGSDSTLRDVRHDGVSQWIAVGDGTTILTSFDGLEWVSRQEYGLGYFDFYAVAVDIG